MPSLGPPWGRRAEVPRAALQGPLLPLTAAPSKRARLGLPKQPYSIHPPNTHRLHVFSWEDCENCACARARTLLCWGRGTTPWLFTAKGGTGDNLILGGGFSGA